MDRLAAYLSGLAPPAAALEGPALYHLSPYLLEGDALLAGRSIHGVKSAVWASNSVQGSALHVARSLRHLKAIEDSDYILQVYRFPAGGPQHARFSRFALPASPGEYMYSTAPGSATLGADVPMVMGKWAVEISTVNVRSYFFE